jgi:hypothetical protein
LTDLKKWVDDGGLPAQYYLIGDEAFVNTNQFLTPFSGTNIGAAKDCFNYYLSSMRQCIERAFGIYTQRWGILWRPLNSAYHNWGLTCAVCAKLHNFCIDANAAEVPPRWEADVREGDRHATWGNEEEPLYPWVYDDDAHDYGRGCRKRRGDIAKQLAEKGLVRPPHALRNSRAL